ncbi:MAG: holo-ACP synthase [Anaerolineae bacterium]
MEMVVGVDIVEIERVGRAVSRWGERFLGRVYTPQERAYCRGRVPSLAACFAAKEAVSKALGTGLGEIAWQEIEVLHNERGQPSVRLHGKALARARSLGLGSFALSLSHSRDCALACAVAPQIKT